MKATHEKNSDTATRKHHLIEYANGPSLEEINGTITVPKDLGFWRTLFAYSGPGALVAVGYMDPGNWSTSITGGQNFQYLLMSVILLSSLIAMLLQYMSAKLGIVSQMDLAQAIRARTSKTLGIVLWLLTELAIMATDIAEVIGGAIALYLLFNIPLVIAVFITVFDVFAAAIIDKNRLSQDRGDRCGTDRRYFHHFCVPGRIVEARMASRFSRIAPAFRGVLYVSFRRWTNTIDWCLGNYRRNGHAPQPLFAFVDRSKSENQS